MDYVQNCDEDDNESDKSEIESETESDDDNSESSESSTELCEHVDIEARTELLLIFQIQLKKLLQLMTSILRATKIIFQLQMMTSIFQMRKFRVKKMVANFLIP